jgi:sorting nexin-4
MDFEGLTVYLSDATSERDRLSAVISGHAGSTGLGIGSYLREKVDALRGADDDRTRVEKMRKLDVKIKEVRPGFVKKGGSHATEIATRCGDGCSRDIRCF